MLIETLSVDLFFLNRPQDAILEPYDNPIWYFKYGVWEKEEQAGAELWLG